VDALADHSTLLDTTGWQLVGKYSSVSFALFPPAAL